jgi:hypothetical protein
LLPYLVHIDFPWTHALKSEHRIFFFLRKRCGSCPQISLMEDNGIVIMSYSRLKKKVIYTTSYFCSYMYHAVPIFLVFPLPCQSLSVLIQSVSACVQLRCIVLLIGCCIPVSPLSEDFSWCLHNGLVLVSKNSSTSLSP